MPRWAGDNINTLPYRVKHWIYRG
ncbi:hypothetical protein MED222_05410 [Vibrio sp. MED222]|nr:hypothetical protein MED222_05410 [Vibrio sp. MED222]